MVKRMSLVLAVLLLWGQTASAGGLSKEQQKALLNYHNSFRNSVSPRSSNMRKLVWSEELADKAQAWADRCSLKHNHVTSTRKFDWVGENIAFHSGEENLSIFVEMWENEGQIYNYPSNTCSRSTTNKMLKTCGHYTQMVWADTQYLGCGWTTSCRGTMPNRLICNYGDGGNWEGEKPYMSGTPCSECPRKLKKCDNGLCSK